MDMPTSAKVLARPDATVKLGIIDHALRFRAEEDQIKRIWAGHEPIQRASRLRAMTSELRANRSSPRVPVLESAYSRTLTA